MSATAARWDAPGLDDGDSALLERVRDGDSEAYGQLWRRHLPSAFTVANRYRGRACAEDIVGEATLRVYDRIRAGNGPTSNFRSYFLSTVRTVAIDLTRAELRLVPTPAEGLEDAAAAVQPHNPALRVDQDLVRTAFGRLSAREQQLLWSTAVQATPPTVVATTMGLSANAVSVAALRARDALRAHYLDAHADRALERANSDECRWVLARMGRYVRDNLRASQRSRIERHLGQCRHANVILAELTEANRALPALMVPVIFVGGAGSALLWAAGGIPAVGDGNSAEAASAAHPSSPAASAATAAATGGALVKAAAVAAAAALGAALIAGPGAGDAPAVADRNDTQQVSGTGPGSGPVDLALGVSPPQATPPDSSPNNPPGPASGAVTAAADSPPAAVGQAGEPDRTVDAPSATTSTTTSGAPASGLAMSVSTATGSTTTRPVPSPAARLRSTPHPSGPSTTSRPTAPTSGSPASSPGLQGLSNAIANVTAQNPRADSNALTALQNAVTRLVDKRAGPPPPR